MKKQMILAAAVALVLSACGGTSTPNCSVGKSCGNSCISKSYTCHK